MGGRRGNPLTSDDEAVRKSAFETIRLIWPRAILNQCFAWLNLLYYPLTPESLHHRLRQFQLQHAGANDIEARIAQGWVLLERALGQLAG